jgi:hypothetical protein
LAPRGYTNAGHVGYTTEQGPQRIHAALFDLSQV